MGILTEAAQLQWVIILSDEGYACHQLQDAFGRRWAWVINAGLSGVLAHIGDWGQAHDLGMEPVPLKQELESHDDYMNARFWVEEKIAHGWKEAHALS